MSERITVQQQAYAKTQSARLTVSAQLATRVMDTFAMISMNAMLEVMTAELIMLIVKILSALGHALARMGMKETVEYAKISMNA